MDPTATARFLLSHGRNQDAKTVIDLIRPFARSPEELNQIGGLYNQARDFQSSYEITQEMMAMANDERFRDQVRVNVIRNCIVLNRIEEALENCQTLIEHGAADQDVRMDMSVCYFILGELDKGQALLEELLTEPRSEITDSKIKFNLGMYNLVQGRFQEGLHNFIFYGQRSGLWKNHRMLDKMPWNGEVKPGMTLLSCTNGGIGDDIVNIRFHRHLQERGIRAVTYTSHPRLAPIFQKNGFEVIEDLLDADPDWQWCPNLAVPVHLKLRPEDLWSGPYLQATKSLPAVTGKIKVGIKCRGNPAYEHDLHRRLPEDAVIAAIPKNCEIYSFHIDDDIENPRVTSLKNQIQDWEDTLALLDQMDIVISSCTSLAHAAGALGKRTIVLSPRLNYYVWARTENGVSPWYGNNVTVLKQTHYSRWTEPLAELRSILDAEIP